MKNLLIAIPMKDPAASMTRLKPHMEDDARHDLALGLFEKTLDIIVSAACSVTVLVVTQSALIAGIARKRGVRVLEEAQSDGLNIAAQRAAKWAVENGFSRMAVLPADLALLAPADVVELAEWKVPSGHVVLCEASDGGTNCLMMSPPDALVFQYGPGSFQAHRRSAMAKGLVVHVMRNRGLRFDLDTSKDLQGWRELHKGLGA